MGIFDQYCLRFLRFLRKINNSILYPKISLNTGRGTEIRQQVFFDHPNQVFIGDNSFVNRGCEFHTGFNKDVKIRIGQNVFIGMNVSFICVSHDIGDERKRAGSNVYKSITVEDGVWIGANSTILQGVTIGKGSIIAAGAVVVHSIPPNTMMGGGTSCRHQTP